MQFLLIVLAIAVGNALLGYVLGVRCAPAGRREVVVAAAPAVELEETEPAPVEPLHVARLVAEMLGQTTGENETSGEYDATGENQSASDGDAVDASSEAA